jgi:uncharacterized protein (TIGR00369 family)
MLLEPNPMNGCFGCGGANSCGMQLSFEQDDAARRIRGTFRVGARYQGGPGFVHGGIIATVLDEVMGKANRFRGVRAVTAELTIEYLKPVPVDQDLVVEGWEIETKGRNLYHAGEIRDATGALLARGQGRFVEVDAARYRSGGTVSGSGTEGPQRPRV